MKNMVRAAAALARIAHTGQTRMDGVEPYINHPRRVAERLVKLAHGCDVVAAAWLHDVVEDTEVTLDDLRALGFPPLVVLAVDLLTRRKGEAHSAYLERVLLSSFAVSVKIADMRDNLASLPEGHDLAKRYTDGLKFLGDG